MCLLYVTQHTSKSIQRLQLCIIFDLFKTFYNGHEFTFFYFQVIHFYGKYYGKYK